MTNITYTQAVELLHQHCDEPHLRLHALAVSAAMGAMAEHFGADADHWRAIGYLHDVDYQHHPEEHLQHTEAILRPAGLQEEEIRAILSHGYEICSDVEPLTEMEKSLFTVDELTGIVMAASLMRPNGISDLETKSVLKKFKDKRFAAKCDRSVIQKGCDMLGMELSAVTELVIRGMRGEMDALGLGPKEAAE